MDDPACADDNDGTEGDGETPGDGTDDGSDDGDSDGAMIQVCILATGELGQITQAQLDADVSGVLFGSADHLACNGDGAGDGEDDGNGGGNGGGNNGMLVEACILATGQIDRVTQTELEAGLIAGLLGAANDRACAGDGNGGGNGGGDGETPGDGDGETPGDGDGVGVLVGICVEVSADVFEFQRVDAAAAALLVADLSTDSFLASTSALCDGDGETPGGGNDGGNDPDEVIDTPGSGTGTVQQPGGSSVRPATTTRPVISAGQQVRGSQRASAPAVRSVKSASASTVRGKVTSFPNTGTGPSAQATAGAATQLITQFSLFGLALLGLIGGLAIRRTGRQGW